MAKRPGPLTLCLVCEASIGPPPQGALPLCASCRSDIAQGSIWQRVQMMTALHGAQRSASIQDALERIAVALGKLTADPPDPLSRN